LIAQPKVRRILRRPIFQSPDLMSDGAGFPPIRTGMRVDSGCKMARFADDSRMKGTAEFESHSGST
jgi:hypothetical protein